MTKSITVADVVDQIIKEQYRDNAKAAQEFRSNCKAWCVAVGSHLQVRADDVLGEAFDAKYEAYLALLDGTRPGQTKAGKNVRTAARRMRSTYVAMLATQLLPVDFNEAFRQAMDAKGYTPAELNRLLISRYYAKERPGWYGAQLWGFFDGSAGPGSSWKGDSRLLLQRCEELLGLEANALVSRAYRTTQPILLGMFSDVPYRMARSRQWHAKYALRALPANIERMFNEIADWRGKTHHLISGELITVNSWSRWASPTTRLMHKQHLKRFYGWLCLPAADMPLADLSEEARWVTGKGLQPSELRLAHLLDLPLLWQFIEFQKARQHNHEHSSGQLGLVLFVNALVSTPHSFLLNHPNLAEEFGFPKPSSKEDWLARMDDFHKQVIKLRIGIDKAITGRQRHPDEPLRHVISHATPYALLLQMIERMEQSPPLRANRQRWAIWARDVAVFRMESEVPLRLKNIVELVIGRHVIKDASTGRWRIFFPKDELKNFYSPHTEDVDRMYSLAASKAIDRYVDEARCELVGANETKLLFLGAPAGLRANPAYAQKMNYALSTDGIDTLVRKHLKVYFGATQGPNIFRHLIATSILKEDSTQVDVAAAVLNNSPNTVRKNYKHLTQSDSLRIADRWFKRQGLGDLDGDKGK